MKAESTQDARPPAWRIGETLPWVIMWTGETRFATRMSERFAGLREVVQPDALGEGAPMLRNMHLLRQRLGVLEHRCHVCGEVTPRDDRYLFPVVTGVFLKVRGRTRFASHLPPTHLVCARRAQTLCPHLRTTYAQPVRFPRDEGEVAPETGVPQGLERVAEQLSNGRPLAFAYYRLYGEAFTRLVARLRHQDKDGSATTVAD